MSLFSHSSSLAQSPIVNVGMFKSGETSFAAQMRRLGYSVLKGPLWAEKGLLIDNDYLFPEQWNTTSNRRALAHALKKPCPGGGTSRSCQAFTDYPWMWAFPFVEELLPDARYVMTLRGCTSLANSTLRVAAVRRLQRFLQRPRSQQTAAAVAEMNRLTRQRCTEVVLRCRRHMMLVASFFAASEDRRQRLLLLDLRSPKALASLCLFLRQPCPRNESFAHANRSPKAPNASDMASQVQTGCLDSGSEPKAAEHIHTWAQAPNGSIQWALAPYLA